VATTKVLLRLVDPDGETWELPAPLGESWPGPWGTGSLFIQEEPVRRAWTLGAMLSVEDEGEGLKVVVSAATFETLDP
jgi:hypothetical protein